MTNNEERQEFMDLSNKDIIPTLDKCEVVMMNEFDKNKSKVISEDVIIDNDEDVLQLTLKIKPSSSSLYNVDLTDFIRHAFGPVQSVKVKVEKRELVTESELANDQYAKKKKI